MLRRPASGEVCVWLVSVAEAMDTYDSLFALLSQPEQERAARYLHEAARYEFVVGRGCLRLLLGYFLRQSPHQVELVPGVNGKLQAAGVEFNLSHAHGQIAIAVSTAGPVGVDIEWEDRAVEVLDVAANVFAANELAELHQVMNSEEQRRLFFTMWTRMEAKAKCLGLGIALLEELRRYAGSLNLRQLALPAGYQGALCSLGVPTAVHEQILDKTSIAWLQKCR